MIRVQVQLTESQHQALKQVAERKGCSISQLVRDGVDSILEREQRVSAAERRERAKAVSGAFRSGLTDVSRRHDDYLSEAYD